MGITFGNIVNFKFCSKKQSRPVKTYRDHEELEIDEDREYRREECECKRRIQMQNKEEL